MTKPLDFIDRRGDIDLFENMLAGSASERVLALIIKPQQGKTYLLRCFQELCQQRGLPVALVNFDTREKGVVHYWRFIRQACEDWGSGNFPQVHKCERRFDVGFPPIIRTGPGQAGVDFGTKGRYAEAEFESISGRDQITTGDIFAYFGPQDRSAAFQERFMDELGRAFQQDLAQLCCQGRVVLLLDTYEQAHKETRDWINEWVLDQLLDHYPQLIIVIAGRPELHEHFSQLRPWTYLVCLREELSPPEEHDVRTYIQIHHLRVHGDELLPFLNAAVHDISVMAKLRDVYKRLPYG